MSAPTEPSGAPVHEKLGRYEVLGEIASGGMATVFLGRVTGAKGFQRLVAIKRLHPHLAHEEDFVSMFLDEARLAARIRHQNVVATLDVADHNGLYLVMEYIEGDRLLGLLRHAAQSAERIPPTVGLRIALDTLAGLQAAHELTDDDGQLLGLVHRDVSPQNILVGLDGLARLTDFGIAKATSRLTVTRDGQLKGKIAYMAPEQTRRVEIDRRVDVFAMGIITWEMLTSKKLFTGESDVEVLNQLLFEPIPRVKDHAPGLPAGLDQAVMKALERDPVKRYNSAAEFADALERASRVFGGPANSRTVAAYVQKVAGERLARDRARINAGGVPAPRGRVSAPGFASTMTPSGVQRLPPPGGPDAADPPHETLASYDAAPSSHPPPLPTRPSLPPGARPAVTSPRGPAVRARASTLQGMAVPLIPGVTTPAVRATPKPIATSVSSAPPAVRADISLVDDDEDAPTHAFGPAPMASVLRASLPPASMPPLPLSPRARAQTGSVPAIVLPPPDASVRGSSPGIALPAAEASPEPRRPSMTATQRLDVVAVPAPAVAPRANPVPPPSERPAVGVATASDPPVGSQAIATSRRRGFPWLVLAAVCVLGASMGVGWQLRIRHHESPVVAPIARAHVVPVAHEMPAPLPPTPVLVVDAAVAAAPPHVVAEPAVVAVVADAAVAAPIEPPPHVAATANTASLPPHVAAATHPTHLTHVASEIAPTPHVHTTATPTTTVAPPVVHPTATPHPASHPAAEDDPFGSSNPYSR